MTNDLMMPRWAQVGTKVSQISTSTGSGLNSGYYEGRTGKITRVLKVQVEVEFPLHRQEDPNATVLAKFKLRRGYRPYGRDAVRVDVLEEMGSKWRSDILWPTEGKALAELRIKKEILQNSYKLQSISMAFAKKNGYHVGLADVVELMEQLHKAAEERERLEERILEIDNMPQDR